jgi:radical SAM protein with 4Fe4S-binding SPASM domain
MMVVLGTNGTRLTVDRARTLALQGLSGVGISLDSLVASKHDAFRGMDGAWRATIQGIQSAHRAGLDVQIQITLTRDNLPELPQVLRFSREVGARVLTVFFLVCTGRGQGLVDLTPEVYDRVLQWLAELQPDGVMVRPRCAPTFRRVLAQKKPDSILLKSDAGRCMAGKNYCRITPDGKVTPCPYMPLVAGSLDEHSFSTIWQSAPLFQALRDPALQGRCGRCEYRELCGGCRARALASSGNPLAEDPWCSYLPGTDKPLRNHQEAAVLWTQEAEARIKKVPFFVRRMVRAAVEASARRQGVAMVTPELLDEARRRRMQP